MKSMAEIKGRETARTDTTDPVNEKKKDSVSSMSSFTRYQLVYTRDVGMKSLSLYFACSLVAQLD